MRRVAALWLLAATVAAAQPAARRWDFDRWNDRQGWTVGERFTGAVAGGAIWLSLSPVTRGAALLASPRFQVYGDGAYLQRVAGCDLESPRGLAIPAREVSKVRLRVLNQSAWTDGFIRWKVREEPDKIAGSARFTLQPDSAGGVDTYIYSGSKSGNYGTVSEMGIGEENTASNKFARSLIKFDLSAIPADASITTATLSLWTSRDLSSNTRTIRVYRLKTSFQESQATWNGSSRVSRAGFSPMATPRHWRM